MEIRAIVEMKVRPEVEITAALECTRKITARAEEQDSVTIAHNYYVDTARRLIVEHEHYEDSKAMIAHLNNMDPDVTQTLMELVEMLSMRVFGDVSDELHGLLTAFGSPEFFDFASGFTRR